MKQDPESIENLMLVALFFDNILVPRDVLIKNVFFVSLMILPEKFFNVAEVLSKISTFSPMNSWDGSVSALIIHYCLSH